MTEAWTWRLEPSRWVPVSRSIDQAESRDLPLAYEGESCVWFAKPLYMFDNPMRLRALCDSQRVTTITVLDRSRSTGNFGWTNGSSSNSDALE